MAIFNSYQRVSAWLWVTSLNNLPWPSININLHQLTPIHQIVQQPCTVWNHSSSLLVAIIDPLSIQWTVFKPAHVPVPPCHLSPRDKGPAAGSRFPCCGVSPPAEPCSICQSNQCSPTTMVDVEEIHQLRDGKHAMVPSFCLAFSGYLDVKHPIIYRLSTCFNHFVLVISKPITVWKTFLGRTPTLQTAQARCRAPPRGSHLGVARETWPIIEPGATFGIRSSNLI